MDRISSLEKEIAQIRKTLHDKEKELYTLKKQWIPCHQSNGQVPQPPTEENQQFPSDGKVQCNRLPKWAIERYSRQMLVPEIGVLGQEKLCAAKVLVVGAGGLGCPAAAYLAGAGVGEIGIVDYDTVDLTNIHRQILHTESDQNMSKVESAANTLRSINSRITVTPYAVQLDRGAALRLAPRYDLVLDCTDNVPTRYMLSDVCVQAKLPLVSGSALKMEGQITIYGYRGDRNPNEKEGAPYVGPCYRCVFPLPPPPAAVGACSSSGVAGPVPGVIGALQALEAIKYIVGRPRHQLLVERMTLFDGEEMLFRTVKLRPRSVQCAACSAPAAPAPCGGDGGGDGGDVDYEAFCNAPTNDKKRVESRSESQRSLRCQRSQRSQRRRREEKERRMTGRSYLGVRVTEQDGKRKWVRDVPKSERRLGPACASDLCARGRHCTEFAEERRQEIFSHFWNELDWKGKKNFVRSLVDVVPPKRRRVKHKGEKSRKGDSKLYHLELDERRLSVCQVMFLNTLGVKEAMIRWWLMKEQVPRAPRRPVKALLVGTYIDGLPQAAPRCRRCRDTTDIRYIDIDFIKNPYQLYNHYAKDMKSKNISPTSRKTFMKVFSLKNVHIFKPKSETDVCDRASEHNNALPTLTGYNNMENQSDLRQDEAMADNYYYNNVQW